MLSLAPFGGGGWSVDATSVVAATLLPWASMSDAGGFLIPGSLMKVTTVMNTRITAAPTVQPISSRVLPWIWAPPGRPRAPADRARGVPGVRAPPRPPPPLEGNKNQNRAPSAPGNPPGPIRG